jgi:RimJ/RimL family protein N-acetyltransferase
MKTARLFLRKPELSDAEAIFQGWSSDPEITRYLGWPRHRSLEDTRAFLQFSDEEWRENGFGPYLIARDGVLVGSTGLHRESAHLAETGYVLTKAAWGQGVASEALAAMVIRAQEVGLIRVEARCHVDNRASARVLEKCGFLREGVHRKHTVFPNLGTVEPQDVECWARVF